MLKLNDSVANRYLTGQWSPTYETSIFQGNASVGYSRLFTVEVQNILDTNEVVVTYLCMDANDVIVSGGYLYLDYTQSTILTDPPDVSIINKYTDGFGYSTAFAADPTVLTLLKNETDVVLQMNTPGTKLLYTIEADDLSQLINITPTGAVFTSWAFGANVIYSELIISQFWLTNENNDLYNINTTGRVGINTDTVIDSNAYLDVNGNVVFRGSVNLDKTGSDSIFIDSDSNLGYDFMVYNHTKADYRLFVDTAGQFGVNTNAPENRLHVVGNAQITDCVSIAAGNTPLARLHVKGMGSTHATTNLLLRNSSELELFRVYDDGVITWLGDPIDDVFDNYLWWNLVVGATTESVTTKQYVEFKEGNALISSIGGVGTEVDPYKVTIGHSDAYTDQSFPTTTGSIISLIENTDFGHRLAVSEVTLDMEYISDVIYTGLAVDDILQRTATDWVNVPISTVIDPLTYWDRDPVNGYIFPKTIADKVGVGTITPQHMFEVNGNIGFTQGNHRTISVNPRTTVGASFDLRIKAGDAYTSTLTGGHLHLTGGAGGGTSGSPTGGNVYIYGADGDGQGSVILGNDGVSSIGFVGVNTVPSTELHLKGEFRLENSTIGTVGYVLTTIDALGNTEWAPPSGGGGSSPLTTKGDIYTYSTADDRLPVGTDGYILSADSAETTGLKWVEGVVPDDLLWELNTTRVNLKGTARLLTLRTDEVFVLGEGGNEHTLAYNSGSGQMDGTGRQWNFDSLQATTTFHLADNPGIGYTSITSAGDWGISTDWTDDHQLVTAKAIASLVSSSVFTDPMTTIGDMIYRDGTNTTTRLPIGATARDVLITNGTIQSWGTLAIDDLSDATTEATSMYIGSGSFLVAGLSNNTVIGIDALTSVTTGHNNFIGGYGAAANLTVGRQNVFIGTQVAGNAVYTRESVMVGHNAGFSMTGATALFNTGVGYRAGYAQSSGQKWTAIGWYSQISGNANFATSVGAESLRNNTAPSSTAMGFTAGKSNTTGASNSIFGHQAFVANVTGSYNSVFGAIAMESSLSSRNSAFGYASLHAFNHATNGLNAGFGSYTFHNLTAGYSNVAIGDEAGRYYGSGTSALTEGTELLLIGRSARPAANATTNETVIGPNAVGNGSNTITLGNSSVTDTYLTGAIDIDGQYTLPIADGSSGQVIVTDGLGTLTWSTAGSGSSPLTTKGDIYTYDTADARLPVSVTDGYVLSADSTEATGLKWIAVAGTGTVTSISAGDGMDFTTITTTGAVDMGTPSTVDKDSTNSTTATSHTHELGAIDGGVW